MLRSVVGQRSDGGDILDTSINDAPVHALQPIGGARTIGPIIASVDSVDNPTAGTAPAAAPPAAAPNISAPLSLSLFGLSFAPNGSGVDYSYDASQTGGAYGYNPATGKYNYGETGGPAGGNASSWFDSPQAAKAWWESAFGRLLAAPATTSPTRTTEPVMINTAAADTPIAAPNYNAVSPITSPVPATLPSPASVPPSSPTPATPPPVAPPVAVTPTTAPATDGSTTTVGTTPQNIGGAGLTGNGPIADALASALGGSGAYQGDVGVPSTAAVSALAPQAAQGATSTSNPALLILIVAGVGIAAWYFLHKKKGEKK